MRYSRNVSDLPLGNAATFLERTSKHMRGTVAIITFIASISKIQKARGRCGPPHVRSCASGMGYSNGPAGYVTSVTIGRYGRFRAPQTKTIAILKGFQRNFFGFLNEFQIPG